MRTRRFQIEVFSKSQLQGKGKNETSITVIKYWVSVYSLTFYKKDCLGQVGSFSLLVSVSELVLSHLDRSPVRKGILFLSCDLEGYDSLTTIVFYSSLPRLSIVTVISIPLTSKCLREGLEFRVSISHQFFIVSFYRLLVNCQSTPNPRPKFVSLETV